MCTLIFLRICHHIPTFVIYLSQQFVWFFFIIKISEALALYPHFTSLMNCAVEGLSSKNVIKAACAGIDVTAWHGGNKPWHSKTCLKTITYVDEHLTFDTISTAHLALWEKKSSETTDCPINTVVFGSSGQCRVMSLFPLPSLQGCPVKHQCLWFLMAPLDSKIGDLVSISSQIVLTIHSRGEWRTTPLHTCC